MTNDPKPRQRDHDDESLVKDLQSALRTLDEMESELEAVKGPKRSALAGVVKRLRRRILGKR